MAELAVFLCSSPGFGIRMLGLEYGCWDKHKGKGAAVGRSRVYGSDALQCTARYSLT